MFARRRSSVSLVSLASLVSLVSFVSSMHAARLQDLVNMKKDNDALDAEILADPINVDQLSSEITEESTPGLFPGNDATAEYLDPRSARVQKRVSRIVSVRIGTTTITFRDVPSNAWFAPYVRDITEQGIVSGYKDAEGKPTGEYKPENFVTVEELAKVAVVVTTDPTLCPDNALNPTASGSWSVPYIGCAEQKAWGIYGDGTIDVKRPATRAEVLLTLLQAFGAQGVAMTGSGWTTGFSDVPTSSLYSIAIARGRDDGIVHGHSDENGVPLGTFGPDEPVNRAEFAKMVSLSIQVYGRP